MKTLEKMARAMCDAVGLDPDEIKHVPGVPPFFRWQAYSLLLGPALRPLLDPDEGMVEAMESGADKRASMVTRGYVGADDLVAGFKAALRNVLGEG